jgi:NADPH:quinone reductase-like Zn-dependent oxidoreductase
MKAVSYQQFGGTDSLGIIEEAIPVVSATDVLIRVKAVSINPMDWKIRKGEMKLMSGSKFPRHTGVDFAGIVEATGKSVNNLRKGDEIFGVVKNTMKDGALAEYISVPATLVWTKPAVLSFSQAASLPMAGSAAVTALNTISKVEQGARILVNGATGGFGMILLQLLRSRGGIVTAVTSTSGREAALSWGADQVIDYSKENVLALKNRYDIIIDLSGKLTYDRARSIMHTKAVFINPVPVPFDIILNPIRNLFRNKKHISLLSKLSAENMNVLLDAIKGGLQIKVNKSFSFEQSRAAYDYAEKGGVVGKVSIELS